MPAVAAAAALKLAVRAHSLAAVVQRVRALLVVIAKAVVAARSFRTCLWHCPLVDTAHAATWMSAIGTGDQVRRIKNDVRCVVRCNWW